MLSGYQSWCCQVGATACSGTGAPSFCLKQLVGEAGFWEIIALETDALAEAASASSARGGKLPRARWDW